MKGFNFKRDINSAYIRALPNTVSLNINLEFYYIFNYEKFSYKSAYLFGETQKKSVGTFTAGMAAGFIHLGNKNPFFNLDLNRNNPINFKIIQTYSIAALGGYMYTLVFGKEKKWYLSGAAFLGPNIHFGKSTYFNNNEKNNFVHIGFNAKYKGSLGYNINKMSFRIATDGSFISYTPSEKSFISNNILSVRLESIYKF